MTVEITDQIVDDMARSIWEADMESHGIATLPTAWERSRDMYHRRARAGIEALIRAGVVTGELP